MRFLSAFILGCLLLQAAPASAQSPHTRYMYEVGYEGLAQWTGTDGTTFQTWAKVKVTYLPFGPGVLPPAGAKMGFLGPTAAGVTYTGVWVGKWSFDMDTVRNNGQRVMLP